MIRSSSRPVNTGKKPVSPPLKSSKQEKKPKASYLPLMLTALLLLITYFLYSPALNKEFINLDDDLYITENQQIRSFTMASIPQIFSEPYMEQYSPLVTTVLGFIYLAGGLDPYLFNLFSILIHLANVLMAFFLVKALFKQAWAGLAAAALFAFHPVNVESVCWNAASFKIGLYAFFFMLSLLVYLKYCDTLKIKYLVLSLLFFILSCFSKEQAVALVPVLLLLDYFRGRTFRSGRIWLEKLPFILIALVFGLVTLAAIAEMRTEIKTTPYSLFEKIGLSAYAFSHYIYKTIAPLELWLHYPLPSLRKLGGAFYLHLFSYIGFGVLAWWTFRKKYTELFLGLLLFLLSLLFSLALAVISLREVIVADRYMYITIVGFGVLLIALWNRLEKYKPALKPLALGVFGVFLLLLAIKTNAQVKLWKDSMTVMTNTLDHHPIAMAFNNRGNVYLEREDYPNALKDYNSVLALDSSYYNAYLNRGIVYRRTGEPDKALADYNTSIRLNPKLYKAILNRGNIYFDRQQDSLAMADYRKVLEMAPNSPDVYSNMGAIYARGGRFEEAVGMFNQALKLKPEFASALMNKAITLEYLNRLEEALATYDLYLRYKPDHPGVYAQRSAIYQKLGKPEDARREMDKAISLGFK